jgi:ribosomal protein L40E
VAKFLYCQRCNAKAPGLTDERCRYCNSLDLAYRDPIASAEYKERKGRKYGRFNCESGSPQDLEDHPEKAAVWSMWGYGSLIQRVDKEP